MYFVSVGEDLGVEIDYLLLKFNYLNLSLRHKVNPVDALGFHEQFFVNHIVLDLKKVLSHSFDRLIYCDPVQLREGIEPLELLVHQCEASVPARCHFELVLCFADRSDLFVLKLGLSKLVYNFLFKLLKGSELLPNQSQKCRLYPPTLYRINFIEFDQDRKKTGFLKILLCSNLVYLQAALFPLLF